MNRRPGDVLLTWLVVVLIVAFVLWFAVNAVDTATGA